MTHTSPYLEISDEQLQRASLWMLLRAWERWQSLSTYHLTRREGGEIHAAVERRWRQR